MNTSFLSEPSTMFHHSFSRWLRWCSIAMLAASIGLLSLSVFAYNYRTTFAPRLVPFLIAALSVAVFLNFYSLRHVRKENREADQAFRDTDCEFSSIFENVLDGILIVNDEGDCLDANPASASILRFSVNKLIGQNISRFFADRNGFTRGWNAFLKNKSQRGRAQLIAGDGTRLFYLYPLRRDGTHTR
jgi:PAS domain-containing protein